jgi:1,4-alpha-glucan branching enzyme
MNSDIPFVISNGHFVDRMKEFFFEDLERFWILASLYWKGSDRPDLTACRLQRLEMENPIFPEIDPCAFAP